MKIMTDKGAWQFSLEQIIAIKNRDTAAMTKFYADNFNIISGMARKFVFNQRILTGRSCYDYEDLIQQVYVDLPYYSFSSRSALWYCIVKGSFLRSNIGGITTSPSRYIRNSAFVYYQSAEDESKNPYYRLDKQAHSPDVFEVLTGAEDREKADEAIIAFLERTVKNPKDLNKIFCSLFTDIPLNQIRGNEYECYAKRQKQTGRA